MAAEFYVPNSFAYIANINMAPRCGMLRRGSLKTRLSSNRFRYTTFTAESMISILFFCIFLGCMYVCEPTYYESFLKCGYLLMKGDDLEQRKIPAHARICTPSFFKKWRSSMLSFDNLQKLNEISNPAHVFF